MLIDRSGIWRPDQDLSARAELMLNLADTPAEDESLPPPRLRYLEHLEYCDAKAKLLLDLADDSEDDYEDHFHYVCIHVPNDFRELWRIPLDCDFTNSSQH